MKTECPKPLDLDHVLSLDTAEQVAITHRHFMAATEYMMSAYIDYIKCLDAYHQQLGTESLNSSKTKQQ